MKARKTITLAAGHASLASHGAEVAAFILEAQHSAYIAPGRDGLKDLIASVPADMRYEPGLVVANGDYVMIHGRYTNVGQLNHGWL
jgi:hypothetical protein